VVFKIIKMMQKKEHFVPIF